MKSNCIEMNTNSALTFKTVTVVGVSLIAILFGMSTVTMIAAQSQNATQTQATQGFGSPPSGPLTAVRHVLTILH